MWTILGEFVCQRYAQILEPRMKSASTTICGGELRVRNIYMSDTHEIQVEIVPTHNDEETAEFLLKYQGGNSFSWRFHSIQLHQNNVFLVDTSEWQYVYTDVQHFNSPHMLTTGACKDSK